MRSSSLANSISRTYILNVTMGGNNQQLPLQLDTGSSDLVGFPWLCPHHVNLTRMQWAASTSCTACGNVNGGLYDPTGSLPTGQSFAINYLAGSAAGPIVWDKVTVGGYTVQHQALGMVNLTPPITSSLFVHQPLPVTLRMSHWTHSVASLDWHCLQIRS